MDSRQISRRFVVTALGGGVALAPVIARSAVSKLKSSVTEPQAQAPASIDASEEASNTLGGMLIAPLKVGSTIAGCTLTKVGEVSHGAIGLVLTDRSGQSFGIEICGRDEDSPRSPAETAKFQLYVVNEGDGSMPTVEEHGIAAMAIASTIRQNEGALDASAFLTLQQRLAYYAGEITRPD